MRVLGDSVDVGNDCKSVILHGLEQRVGELLYVPIGVDIAGRLNRLMPRSFWTALRFPVASRRRLPGRWCGSASDSMISFPKVVYPTIAKSGQAASDHAAVFVDVNI